ncbi:MAG: bifunctional UDP-3-O-[3-hydroxymyristoyl] N-acetylglucosamine deacetylase/3-hydroxyacyl-ACP dehydratase [Candidatus Delongbacteria bacterium]|jgi:UDP-3-O-[3-hydroxymyristoyl] N-acetylglucosamine deacetylase/3-hydroxyacyl-[acyl-carrier-protein] dehydratase|nr:bifunctional UDP-3-O-[3-hydroxymyristoyl] N-acetylglucosamine deacetylase/3-hydroxyacyl-ACP dehydratase [Candidatus Delongbacteria bacterium]
MDKKQTSIKKAVTLQGIGLHTGDKVELTIKPAPVNHWYKFKRIDVEGEPIIEAIADNVVDTSRGTSLAKNDVRVSTVEHLLAAAYGLGIDNLLFELNGPEVPILDGSAKYWVDALKNAGIEEQDADRIVFEFKEKKVYKDEAKEIELALYPDDDFRMNVLVDYKSTELVNQFAGLSNLENFAGEVAPCRTFAFLSELEPLLKAGLIKGGDLDNAIVLVDKVYSEEEFNRIAKLFNKPGIKVKTHGVLNNLDLHFINEPARHKLLDIIGDLALVGYRIKGNIIAKRPGHHVNTELAKNLRKHIVKELKKPDIPEYDPDAKPLYDVNEIKKRLPHRSPFLFVDKVLSLTEHEVVGIKNVTLDEPYFIGHFPDEPIMPGVLQIEAMAQVGGILVLATVPDPENYLTFFMKIDKVKFRKQVVPGDTIIMKLSLIQPIRRGIAYMSGEAFVGEKLACEAELTAQIVKIK